LTYVPYLKTTGELKTKPTQASVKELLHSGIQPDILLCRSDYPMDKEMRCKIAMFCNVQESSVMNAMTVESIYTLPIEYHKEGIDCEILRHFGLPCKTKVDYTKWEKIVYQLENRRKKITVGIAGKYLLADAYKSLYEALLHAGLPLGIKVKTHFIDTENLEKNPEKIKELKKLDAIIVPGGFGYRGVEGKIQVAKFARENKIPYLGICFGMQIAVIEASRNLLGIKDASSSEFKHACTPIIGLMTEWEKEGTIEKRSEKCDLGGTLRLGSYQCNLVKDSLVEKMYQKFEIKERHRHRYEMDIRYENDLKKKGIIISGKSPDGKLPEIIENTNHPWFIGVQFHPELQSKPFAPHPLFSGLIKASLERKISKDIS
ncbi:MAG: CTP synthase, partial [Alphaproteobacteria bacterium]